MIALFFICFAVWANLLLKEAKKNDELRAENERLTNTRKEITQEEAIEALTEMGCIVNLFKTEKQELKNAIMVCYKNGYDVVKIPLSKEAIEIDYLTPETSPQGI